MSRAPRDRRPAPSQVPGADEFGVVLAAPTWSVNGVNVFSANLARGLTAAGGRAHIVLTEDRTELVAVREPAMPRPPDVAFEHLPLPIVQREGWGLHWGAMVRYLEDRAPCVYIPNYDWRHSCVTPRLTNNVAVIGVIHSDDPLHYDHLRRLGGSWNAVVAVSDAIARRSAELCPSIANRIVTIPIGVPVPASRPDRPGSAPALRLVYHGVLKQHQKRVLDLPAIVAAALAAGVPVELTVVGGGPDEAALRRAAQPLIDRGSLRMAGVMAPDAAAAALDRYDVFVLASEFEGLPTALVEAMAHGCVPVVTRTRSGIPELVRDGKSGFLVDVGDIGAFADRFRILWTDAARRRRMSARAYDTVARSRYRVETMVDAYRELLAGVWEDVAAGRFRRSLGPIVPPPPSLAGIDLLPVALPHVRPDVGAFSSADDAEDFDDQISAPRVSPAIARRRDPAEAEAPALDQVRVVVALPAWTADGVTAWSEDLVRGLRAWGMDARLLLTEESTALVQHDEPRLPRPPDLPFEELQVHGADAWGARWGALRHLLEAAAPCIYFPTNDWRHSCVVPALSDRVLVVGTLHESGGLHTEHAARLGFAWNGAVATNRDIARQLRRTVPGLEPRLATIPHGVAVPASPPVKSADERDSVLDPRSLAEMNRQTWLQRCGAAQFIVADPLAGDRERALVEAMAHGCLPVWVETAPSERWVRLIGDAAIVARGWEEARDRMKMLASDPARLQQLSVKIHEAVRDAEYRLDAMIDRYLELFRRLTIDAASGRFHRARGPMRPPPGDVNGQSVFPIDLTYDSELGRFPTELDATRFLEESTAVPADSVQS